MNTPIITQATITQHLWGHCEVIANLDDNNRLEVFRYYPDEISFTEAELVGLTVEQAKALRHRRDVEYLQT
jgi:hypothetical protein